MVTFNIRDCYCYDVSRLLDRPDVTGVSKPILTRAGHHCAIPAMRHLGIFDPTYYGNVRVSFHYYNTFEEVDQITYAVENLTRIDSLSDVSGEL